jgi:nucleoside-diphosphate-sugar epimerase
MPVIVVGADSPVGRELVPLLAGPQREVRAFVSDPDAAIAFKEQKVKVAVGDLSDEGHLSAACSGCFSAILIASAAADGREISFLPPGTTVTRIWAAAVGEADVQRVIWVGSGLFPPVDAPEVGHVPDDSDPVAAARIAARLDDAVRLGEA